MDLLGKLEQALEGLFEGVFSRAFKSPVQPIEVAKRLTREMENHRTISVNTTYVPNIYTISLPADSYQTFQAIQEQLIGEFTQYLNNFIAERHYHTVGPLVVKMEESAELRAGEFQTIVTSVAQANYNPVTAMPVSKLTHQIDVPLGSPTPLGIVDPTIATTLEVTVGEARGAKFPITNGFSIGRSPSNNLVLSESGVSRTHAKIQWQEYGWVLYDQGSTNGTFVNDRRISSQLLNVGDLISICGTSIELH